ncbi:MAG: YgiT-type zinc finger protein [Syntrophobacteraceae bacterium]|nr:YgiT-type zinc finger protein [Syntrophobacteraceae bacterium]
MPSGSEFQWCGEAIRRGEMFLSEHVIRELVACRVSLSIIISVLSSGRVIEIHSHPRRMPFYVALGFAGDKPLHVMFCGSQESGVRVLIVYQPALPLWSTPRTRSRFSEEYMENFKGNCPFCTGAIKPVVVGNFDYRLEGRLYVIKDVPAGLCEQCGEKYISLDTARKMETLASSGESEELEAVKVLRFSATV